MEFKENFLWGVATAANQCEGGYLEGGKGLTIQDYIKRWRNRKTTDVSQYHGRRSILSEPWMR
ncbi:MAG: family 1 glycosylhydrolase [Roseburia sp.]